MATVATTTAAISSERGRRLWLSYVDFARARVQSACVMRRPFYLVEQSISHDTVEATRILYEQATDAKMIGCAFGAMYNGGFFIVDTAGECFRNPVWTIGMLDVLMAKLRRQATQVEG